MRHKKIVDIKTALEMTKIAKVEQSANLLQGQLFYVHSAKFGI